MTKPSARHPRDWGLWPLVGAVWTIFGLAVSSHLGGNPTAINGVVGAGLGGVFATVTAVLVGRVDR